MKPIIKQLLRERLLTKEDIDIRAVSDFVNFTKEQLGIDDDIKVELAFERTPDLVTTAYYNLDGLVKVYVKDRAIIDVCRSIGHELQHHKQNLEGRLSNPTEDGKDGSEIENEANAQAAIVMRQFNKIYPEFFKDTAVDLEENFADGKNPQDKGDSKRHGINTKASVSSLRKTAKQGGRKGQLAHWLANMKSGRKK